MKSQKSLIALIAAIILLSGVIVFLISSKNNTAPTENDTSEVARQERIKQIEALQQQQGSSANTNNITESPSAVTSIDETDSINEEWMPPVTAGQKVVFTGYHNQYEYYDDMSGQIESCNGFFITEGDFNLVSKINAYGYDGNIINLNWSSLSEADKSKIESSSAEDTITITFTGNPAGVATEIPACVNHWLTVSAIEN